MKTKLRFAIDTLLNWTRRGKVLILIGARQVGKTTLLKSLFTKGDNYVWFNADEVSVKERLTNLDLDHLKNLVGNSKTVIIDEVQRIPNSGLLLKLLVDNFPDVQFIATGSSALEISDNVFEPLTGRHLLFHLHPFSLLEMYPNKTPFELEKRLSFHLIYGSYPDIFNHPNDAKVLLKNLAGQYLYRDVLIWKDIRKPELLDKLLKLLAYQMGAEVSIHELSKQLKVKSETVENYIDLLEKSFVIFRLRAFGNNPRKEISKMNKIYFWDNGIRNAIIDQFNGVELRNDVGALWENYMVSERLKTNQWYRPDAKSFFWRSYNGSEVDYVEIIDDKIYAYEMKWNTNKKYKVTAAFLKSYPDAVPQVITPINFSDFVGK
jgi:predicted AAA+ superfamily ATPase